MGNEYKFMFDRRFDKKGPSERPERKPKTFVSFSQKKNVPPPSGIPTISDLLDTIGDPHDEDDGAEEAAEKEAPVAAEKPAEQKPEPETAAAAEKKAEPPPEEKKEPEPKPETKKEPKVQAPPPPPPPPMFSQETLEAAKALAYEEGVHKGLADGRQMAWDEAMKGIEKQNANMLELLNDRLKALFPVCQKAVDEASSTALSFALAVVKKVLPASAEKNALDEIVGLLENNFRFLKEEPKITIKLNSVLADDIRKPIQDIVVRESFAGKVVVVRDDSLPVGDCKIEWKNGGLERNVEEILKQTESLVSLYLNAPAQKAGDKNK